MEHDDLALKTMTFGVKKHEPPSRGFLGNTTDLTRRNRTNIRPEDILTLTVQLPAKGDVILKFADEIFQHRRPALLDDGQHEKEAWDALSAEQEKFFDF
ncbi:MAG TPA: hypothetical protein VE954_31075 [Oligoflexus sp.]|uniref:hypothetical protein n=1 Tax=Oligoflexus sp. TaxID=1971216 RepID=UPI002D69EF71|nr:hypothetical protein [Oligoflexus sp.]HYX37567.1 hypothetical protein [Oligoflexus sp.]